MTKNTKILLDTNILVYCNDTSSIYYEKTRQFIKSKEHFFISDRTLLEFYRATTGPIKLEPNFVLGLINFYKNSESYTVLYPNYQCTELTFQLAEQYNARSGKIFDLNILATAIANDIDVLYTKNIKDYPETNLIQILDPTL